MKTLQQLRDTAKDLGLTIPSRISKEKLQALIDQAKPKTASTIHRLPSMATQSRLESATHDGSDLDAVRTQKEKDLEKSRQEIKAEIQQIVDRRKPKRLQDFNLGEFLTDIPDKLINRDDIVKPVFRKIMLVKRMAAIDVLTGSVICHVFIDKLGYRFYDDQGNKHRYSLTKKIADDQGKTKTASTKPDICKAIASIYGIEDVYLKADNLERLRFNQFSVDRISYCAVDKPYNGDPKIHSHYMVIKNENEILGVYASLDLAKHVCLNN